MCICVHRESTSKPATRSAPSPTEPIYHGSWTTACLPCRFLRGFGQACYILNVNTAYQSSCYITDMLTWVSDTLYVCSQPQVYGYDDLQMLQTRIPLVSLVLWSQKSQNLRKTLWDKSSLSVFMVCSKKMLCSPLGLLQHPVCDSHNSTDWQRGQPGEQPLLWWDLHQRPSLGSFLIYALLNFSSSLLHILNTLINFISLGFPVHAGDLSKFGRGDASSPAPATTLAQTQQNQTQTHHTTQQPFLNPALPPGYSYTSLPYYTGMPGLPNTFQYGPAVFPVRILELAARYLYLVASITGFYFILNILYYTFFVLFIHVYKVTRFAGQHADFIHIFSFRILLFYY